MQHAAKAAVRQLRQGTQRPVQQETAMRKAEVAEASLWRPEGNCFSPGLKSGCKNYDRPGVWNDLSRADLRTAIKRTPK
jgi:hypothetical protein